MIASQGKEPVAASGPDANVSRRNRSNLQRSVQPCLSSTLFEQRTSVTLAAMCDLHLVLYKYCPCGSANANVCTSDPGLLQAVGQPCSPS